MKKIFVLLYTCCATLGVLAQTNTERLIDFKHRFLKPKAQADAGPAVDSLRTLHLMIAGNVYQTEKHINYCYNADNGTYNFRNELKYIQPVLSLGDLTLANLKTSFGGDVYNMFSAPDEFALAMKYAGINAVMHANLHTANVDRATFQRTRELMNTFEMRYTGAFSDNFQRLGNYPLMIEKKGFRIAILNYGTMDNRPDVSGNFYINEIDKDQIQQDFRMVYANKPDFTIVYFDWGAEQQDIPSFTQIELARFCFQQGADLVVGTNPNAPMRLDYVNYYRNGAYKEGIVAYSLGNLVGSNQEIRNRNGYVIDMELKKNNYTGETGVGDWGVIPVYTYYDTLSTPGKTRVYSMPCSAVENGDIFTSLPYIEKRRVINSAYEVRKLLGATADEIQYNLTEMVANNVMETIDLTNAAWNNKYAPKRAKEVKPTNAPVLPATAQGSNNPPSISKIYGDAPVVAADNSYQAEQKKENRYEEEKKKAEQVFENKIPTKYNKPTSTNNKNLTTGNEPTTGTGQTTNQPNNTTTTQQPGSVSGIGTSAPVATNGSQQQQTQTKEQPTPTQSTQQKQQNEQTLPVTAEKQPSAQTNQASATQQATPTQQNAPVQKNQSENNTATTEQALQTKQTEQTTQQNIKTEQATQTLPNTTTPQTAPIKKEEEVTASAKETKRPEAEQISVNSKQSEEISAGTSIAKTEVKAVKDKNLRLEVDTFYRIEFYKLSKFLPLDTNYYTHLKGYEVVEDFDGFHYLLGKYRSYDECYRYWKAQIQPRYKDSRVITFIDGKRVLE